MLWMAVKIQLIQFIRNAENSYTMGKVVTRRLIRIKVVCHSDNSFTKACVSGELEATVDALAYVYNWTESK